VDAAWTLTLPKKPGTSGQVLQTNGAGVTTWATPSSGGVTGSGTTGTIPVWSGSTALGDSPLTVASGNVTATGTGSFSLPNGTTAQRPGTPSAGATRYNTTNGALEYYGASAWEVPLKSATATGLGTAGKVFYADANAKAAVDTDLHWDATNNRLGIGIASPAESIHSYANVNAANMIRVENVSTGTAAQATIYLKNSVTNNIGTIFKTSTGYTTYRIIKANDMGIYNWNGGGAGASDMSFLNDATNGNILFAAGQSNTVHLGIYSNGRVSINNSSPQRTLHVTGEVRITDLTTDTPTRIVGADADGDLSEITAGNGITIGATVAFNRNAPVTKTGNFTVAATENWLIVNNASANTTVTLPTASTNTGRELMLKNLSGTYTVISNASNVVPLAGGAAGTAILPATAGAWATLVSDGTNWIIMQSN